MVKRMAFCFIFLSLSILYLGENLFPAGKTASSKESTAYEHYEKNLDWLLSMLRPVKQDNREFLLMQSYEDFDNRCWIYDQALAVLALTAARETAKAKKILDTLAYIANDDGSFYFSYLISTLEPTSQKTYTGSIAWVAMAINFYRKMTGDRSYGPLLEKTLAWVAAQQVADKNDPRCGGLSLGVRNDAFSTEHNLDSYSAFRYSGIASYKKKAKQIKKFILRHLYHKAQGRFLTGYKDDSKYLDCQGWAVLSFGKKYADVLEFAEQHFLVQDGKIGQTSGIRGFFERNAANAPVWSEGTAGVALAYYFTGNKEKGDSFHRQIVRMAGANGGIRYATENTYDFSTSPSVAGTSWYMFYEMKLNPFKPNRKTKRTVNKYLKKRRKITPKK